MDAYKLVDNPNIHPYDESNETLWDGLDIIDYVIMPHWDSNHPESKAIDSAIKYCEDNTLEYKKLRDGEVIII